MSAQLPEIRPAGPPHSDQPPRDIFETGSAVRFGVLVVCLFLGLFAAWGALAPLSSAAIAPGVLMVESKRQQVEHLEGGIVRSIRVREGDAVTAGDLLLEIESEASRSRLEQVDRRLISLLASRSRLTAEIEGTADIEFDARLVARGDDENVRADMNLQTQLFQQRQTNTSDRRNILNDQIRQLEAQIDGLGARQQADRQRLSLVGERLAGLEKLAERGFASSVQLAEVRAQEANLQGSLGDNQARMAEAQLKISELEKELQNLETAFLQSAIEELQKVETELDEFDASLTAAEDVVTRMAVVAPISGRIVGLSVSTVGSVIDAGERLMEIVPQNDRIVIDALVKPEDIDSVFLGQRVDVRLTAFNPRTTPPVPGQVTNISADRIVDERSGVAAYSAEIEMDLTEANIPESAELYPGMPAEVMIILEDRTFLDYLLGPIIKLFERGMREA